MTLTALVHGSGFAGQGHTRAMRDAGVTVVGMVSRTADVVAQVSAELNIPYHGTDWDQALRDLTPDIVAIGTPGGAHVAPILSAIAQGCHVFCDKPLATNAADAKSLFDAATKAGVKTAYAASYRYMPHVLHAKELVAQGAIGEPQEVECMSHFNLNPLIPFGWSHRLDTGGGRLNNNFVHKLSIVQHVLDGAILAVHGTIRGDMQRAPLVAGVHDFRERRSFIPQAADDPALKWAESDADWSYTVQAKLASPFAALPVSALFKHSGLQPRFQDDYIAFYGSDGAIHLTGHYGHGPLHLFHDGAWQALPLPQHIALAQPAIDDPTQRNWSILAAAFVADVSGQPGDAYQTFYDGWQYQAMIDGIRSGKGWATAEQGSRL